MRNALCVLALHAHGQSLDAAQKQKRRVRIHAAAERRTQMMDLVDQFAPSGSDAANDVGVAAKIFRSRMQHQSMPHSAGRQLIGVPNVASIVEINLCFWASAAIFSRSTTRTDRDWSATRRE